MKVYSNIILEHSKYRTQALILPRLWQAGKSRNFHLTLVYLYLKGLDRRLQNIFQNPRI